MRVHFIAIGGSAMHNLALAMHHKGFQVSGSDDEIFEPSRTRLEKAGILPAEIGWFPEKITHNLDAVILGMHARQDNPELQKAHALNIPVYSYPEYIYQQTKDKTRVVIGGSHGKTSITAMILHVLQGLGKPCDYMVGAQLAGFDTMVKLTQEAPVAILEGDEYLSSPIDRRPKFHLYQPNIALLSGIAWDHINVFPTFENYVAQFTQFVSLIEPNGCLIYCETDPELVKVAQTARQDITVIPYNTPRHRIENGTTYILHENGETPLLIFGNHNLLNLQGALLVCKQLGVSETDFYNTIKTFKGAAKRLELVGKTNTFSMFKDFAHSPSKLKATTSAVKQQFPNRKLVACMELHTFSSLNENFLAEYKGAMALADEAYVYYNPHTLEHKKLKAITPQQVENAFGSNNVKVYTNSQELMQLLKNQRWQDANLLMMSSGNFDGVNLDDLYHSLNK